MKKLIAMLAVVVAFGAVAYFRSGVHAQQAAAPATAGSKVRLINIAKVLRNYNKANALGSEITKIRKDFIDRVNAKRTQIEQKKTDLIKSGDASLKDRVEKEITAMQREIQDIDRDAQKTLSTMSNETIVRVYKDIKDVIDRISVANGLELVFCYPDASLPTEENTPAVAQLKLQTPAAMPFYHRGLDITDYVVDALNRANPVAAPQGGAEPMGTPQP